LADGNRIRIIPIKASRGIFYDRNGVPLVSKRPSFAVMIATLSNSMSDAVVTKLSAILDMKAEEIQAKINRHTGLPFEPIQIKSDVDTETITRMVGL
jgi:penicillin-binding protein 2